MPPSPWSAAPTALSAWLENEAATDCRSPEMRFLNKVMPRAEIRDLVTAVFERYGNEVTAEFVDKIKELGFAAATRAGVSISIDDVVIPHDKAERIAETEKKVNEIDRQFGIALRRDRRTSD